MTSKPMSGGEDIEDGRDLRRDIGGILVRRRWTIAISTVALGVAGVITSQLWPVTYRSEALILVEHQKVPEQYVTPNVIADIQYRLDSMTQQVLSRTRLQQLIERFGLYQKERARLPLDMVIDEMRDDIQIGMVQTQGRNNQLTAFRISYSAADRFSAQRIANELTSIFIDQNIQARTQQSMSTTTFLENQLEQARKDLATQESQLRQYKLRYLGELPQQEQSNLQILLSLQAQLQVAGAAQDRAEQQKVYLSSMKAEHQNMQRALDQLEPVAGPGEQVTILEARIRDQRRLLSEKQTKYTPLHPDVVALKDEIATNEALLEKLKTAEATSHRRPTRESVTLETRNLADVESRLKATEVEIAKSQEEVDSLRQKLQQVQKKLGTTPVREQELAEVTRNYENSKKYYESLLEKKLGSELATNLEKRQQGEQFRILDPANLPEKPAQPNRLLIVAVGWVLGIIAGAGLALIKESADTSVRSENDLGGLTGAVPLLVRIPMLHDAKEIRHRKAVRRMEAAGAVFVLLLCAASTIHAYIVG